METGTWSVVGCFVAGIALGSYPGYPWVSSTGVDNYALASPIWLTTTAYVALASGAVDSVAVGVIAWLARRDYTACRGPRNVAWRSSGLIQSVTTLVGGGVLLKLMNGESARLGRAPY
jgi:hypothetical protein